MDFKDQIKELVERINKSKDHIKTEEATKNAVIMPFIQTLGYDVFNPAEVVPEFVADIGIKKGEKVDYAIMQDGKPVIIIECKCLGEDLELHNTQLFRYYAVVDAKFALLTNGIRYQFYADLEKENKMDEKPFLDFSITEINDAEINELKKFHKSYFDIVKIIDTAFELKASNEIKAILKNEFKTPTDDFVRFFVKQIYQGKATERIIAVFREIIKKSANQLISEMVNEKIKAALEEKVEIKEETGVKEESIPQNEIEEKKIETTQLEFEGYAIVKAILRSKGVDISRISYKDSITYFAILLDQNTRKPICRLWLNTKNWYVSLFDTEKREDRKPLENLDDIYKYENELFKTVQSYD
jgi:hypothetical protein